MCIINLLMVSKKILLALAIYLNYVWMSQLVSVLVSVLVHQIARWFLAEK